MKGISWVREAKQGEPGKRVVETQKTSHLGAKSIVEGQEWHLKAGVLKNPYKIMGK